MKKKKLLLLTLVFFISLGLPGCKDGGNQSEDIVPAEEAANAVEIADEVKISIVPPEGWKPVEGSVLQVHYGNETASFMVKTESFPVDSLDSVVEEAKDIFTSTFDDVQYIGEPERITIDGKDARKFTFTCEVSSMKMKFEYAYLYVGNEVYAITFGDLADHFDSLISDYEKILSDIKFE